MEKGTENSHKPEEIIGPIRAVPSDEAVHLNFDNFSETIDVCIEASFIKRLSRRAVEYRASRIDNMLFYDHPSEDKFVVETHDRMSEEETYEKKEYLSKEHFLQEIQRNHELSMFRQNKFRMERISDLLENIADNLVNMERSSSSMDYFFSEKLKFIIDDIDRIATSVGEIAFNSGQGSKI